MDKQTEIMWEAEFVKQYPKPEDSRWWPRLARHELREANKATLRAKLYSLYHERRIKPLGPAEFECMVNQHYALYLREVASRSNLRTCPWKTWKKECYDRFDAIFSAEPTYALEELRKGNLLIEGNV